MRKILAIRQYVAIGSAKNELATILENPDRDAFHSVIRKCLEYGEGRMSSLHRWEESNHDCLTELAIDFKYKE